MNIGQNIPLVFSICGLGLVYASGKKSTYYITSDVF